MGRVPTAEEEAAQPPAPPVDGGGSDGSGGGSGDGSGEPAEDTTVTVTDEKTGSSALVTTTTPQGSVTAQVTIPQGVSSAVLPIPCRGSAGTVAVRVLEDGSRQILPYSLYQNGTLHVQLDSSAKIELVDRTTSLSDVGSNAWFADAVQFTSSRELFRGVGGGAFAPGRSMTRAMLVTVLHRLEGSPTPTTSSSFQDVDEDAWYSQALHWAVEQGIIQGTSDGRFDPNRPMTREMLALILYRCAGSPELSPGHRSQLDTFQDGEQVSPWARQAMEWACAKGIFLGSAQGTLRAQDNTTRAEVSVLLHRYVAAAMGQ